MVVAAGLAVVIMLVICVVIGREQLAMGRNRFVCSLMGMVLFCVLVYRLRVLRVSVTGRMFCLC